MAGEISWGRGGAARARAFSTGLVRKPVRILSENHLAGFVRPGYMWYRRPGVESTRFLLLPGKMYVEFIVFSE